MCLRNVQPECMHSKASQVGAHASNDMLPFEKPGTRGLAARNVPQGDRKHDECANALSWGTSHSIVMHDE